MRTKTGIAISTKMKNTVVVRVDLKKRHKKYKKMVRTSRKFYADDPGNTYKEGDTVTIYESKPLSKLKRWTVVKQNI